jgi:hypothetical protein
MNTVTAPLNKNPDHVARSERAAEEINVMNWLGGVRSVKALEEVIGLGSYGKTLTAIVGSSVYDDIEEEEEATTMDPAISAMN